MKVRSKLSLVSRVRLREDILEYGGSEGVEARVDTSSSIHFSPREKQVLAELVNGHTNMRIAEIVGLSEHTVGDYVKSVYKKLQVTSRRASCWRQVWCVRALAENFSSAGARLILGPPCRGHSAAFFTIIRRDTRSRPHLRLSNADAF